MLMFSIFSYFIFLFLNFLSLFVFIFCEMARSRRFSVIFAKAQWHPCAQVARAQSYANHVQHMVRLSCATHGALIMCNTWCAYHVQHMVRLSCATHGALIMCNTWCTYHVQHMVRLSCATHGALIMCNTWCAYHVQHAVCHLVRRDCSAVKFDRVEIMFILALFNCLKPFVNERGEKTGAP